MFFAKSAPDLMQRLPRLPTTPHVELLLCRKPKPSPWFHQHHLCKQLYTRWCCIDRLNWRRLPGVSLSVTSLSKFTKVNWGALFFPGELLLKIWSELVDEFIDHAEWK